MAVVAAVLGTALSVGSDGDEPAATSSNRERPPAADDAQGGSTTTASTAPPETAGAAVTPAETAPPAPTTPAPPSTLPRTAPEAQVVFDTNVADAVDRGEIPTTDAAALARYCAAAVPAFAGLEGVLSDAALDTSDEVAAAFNAIAPAWIALAEAATPEIKPTVDYIAAGMATVTPTQASIADIASLIVAKPITRVHTYSTRACGELL
jgi:hypothetical protein